MVEKLDKVPVVIVGMGWAGGIIASELTNAGIKVLGLERGKERKMTDYLMAHDELRYHHRHDMMQDLSRETLTPRNSRNIGAVQMRQQATSLVGDGLDGADRP